MKSKSILVAALIGCGNPAPAQATGPEFEVASVRLSLMTTRGSLAGEVSGGPGTSDPARIRYHEVPFVRLRDAGLWINRQEAGFVNDGLVAPEGWMRADQYEVVANIKPGSTPEEVRAMLQNLLADRFALRVHREIQKFMGSEVVIAKDGPKLQLQRIIRILTRLFMNKDAPRAKTGSLMLPEGHAGLARSYQKGCVYITGVGQSISDLLGIADFRYYHVVDKTGLIGKFDFPVRL